MSKNPIKIFIGSGERSLLECKTLIYSLKKYSDRYLDIYIFNGTHNTIEHDQEQPVLTSLPLSLKYLNAETEHTFYRFLVSKICRYQGKAIYLDSDIVCLKDIGELFDTPLNGYDFLALPRSIEDKNWTGWRTSVQLIDCTRCKFDLDSITKDIKNNVYSAYDFLSLDPKFLTYYQYKIGKLEKSWNSLDTCNGETKLIHYTDLDRQPWRYKNHPFGSFWFDHFYEAINSGDISSDDIQLSIRRFAVRKDILYGNSSYNCLLGKLKAFIRNYKIISWQEERS